MTNIIRNIKKKEFNQKIDDILSYVEQLEETNEELKVKLNEFREIDEIKKLEERNKLLIKNSVHIFSETEKKDYTEFSKVHKEKCGNTNISFIITGNGIGNNVYVRCNICKADKDITDYNW